MKENNLNERPFDAGVPLSIGEAEFNSKINEINDNDALLKFCRAKNKANDEKEKLNDDQKKLWLLKLKTIFYLGVKICRSRLFLSLVFCSTMK